MANERHDGNSPSRGQEDDRQRLNGRWGQDDETGYLQRRFDDYERDDGSRDQGSDNRSRSEASGAYGETDRNGDNGRGHAFDFARRGPGRPDSREGHRSWEAQDRFDHPEGYGVRSDSGLDRAYGNRSGQEPSGGRPREGWPEKGNWISRHVSADGRYSGEDRSSPPVGSFRGKGPKGYIRSDERVKEDVSDRLSEDDTLDASEITVEVVGGEVTLSGYVDSRQAKHTAEDCAEQCTGVSHVQNNLRVGNAADKDRSPASSDAGTGRQ